MAGKGKSIGNSGRPKIKMQQGRNGPNDKGGGTSTGKSVSPNAYRGNAGGAGTSR